MEQTRRKISPLTSVCSVAHCEKNAFYHVANFLMKYFNNSPPFQRYKTFDWVLLAKKCKIKLTKLLHFSQGEKGGAERTQRNNLSVKLCSLRSSLLKDNSK